MTRRLPKGVYRSGAKYRAVVWAEGRPLYLGTFATVLEAQESVALWRTARRSAPVRGITLEGYGRQWMDRREELGLTRGIRQEKSRWRAHIATAPFANKPLRLLKRGDIVKWIKQLLLTEARDTITDKAGNTTHRHTGRQLRRQTVVHVVNLLRACLQSAADEEVIKANPAADVKVPRVPEQSHEWTYLTAEEIRVVTQSEAIPLEKRLIYTIAIYTGLRKGELWGLRWPDVDLAGSRLVVRRSHGHSTTKSGKARDVPLLPPALAAFEQWRDMRPRIGRAHVFGPETGGRFGRDYDAQWRARWHRELDRRHTFHAFRHTCASHLVMGTWKRAFSLVEVQHWLGHSSITVTQRYAHLAPGNLHDAAALMAKAWEKIDG